LPTLVLPPDLDAGLTSPALLLAAASLALAAKAELELLILLTGLMRGSPGRHSSTPRPRPAASRPASRAAATPSAALSIH